MTDKTERKAALDFAARIRSAVGRRRKSEQKQKDARRLRGELVEKALERLFDDLEAMGRAAEVLAVDRRKSAIVLRLDDRDLRIASKPAPDQPDRLEISARGVEEKLSGYFSEEIDRWALKIEYPEKEGRPAHSQVYALLGMGMGWLVEHGLELSLGEPDEVEPEEPSDAGVDRVRSL